MLAAYFRYAPVRSSGNVSALPVALLLSCFPASSMLQAPVPVTCAGP
jgi:hypothetical protein